MITAKELIKKWDDEKGQQWSDDTEEIAKIMNEFLETRTSEILRLITTYTKNRGHWKSWEEAIITICEKQDV